MRDNVRAAAALELICDLDRRQIRVMYSSGPGRRFDEGDLPEEDRGPGAFSRLGDEIADAVRVASEAGLSVTAIQRGTPLSAQRVNECLESTKPPAAASHERAEELAKRTRLYELARGIGADLVWLTTEGRLEERERLRRKFLTFFREWHKFQQEGSDRDPDSRAVLASLKRLVLQETSIEQADRYAELRRQLPRGMHQPRRN